MVISLYQSMNATQTDRNCWILYDPTLDENVVHTLC